MLDLDFCPDVAGWLAGWLEMILKRGNYADTLAVNYAESHFSAWSAANVVFDVCSSTNQARMKGGIYDGDFLIVFSRFFC